MRERNTAEGFLPGEFITEELEVRGWTQADLADIVGKTPAMINEVIKGKRHINAEIAEGFAAAFGTSAEYWTNLESAYQYWLLRKNKSNPTVSERKAKLMSVAPYRELVRRGWIEPTEDIEILEHRILSFFEIESVEDEMPVIKHAAKKSSSYETVSPSLHAWLRRARHLAKGLNVEKFDNNRLKESLPSIKKYLQNPEDIRLIPKVLAELGIRMVIVEHLSGTKVDGALLWLEDESPVIVLSLRFDRIDSFWHTLMHEIGHILNGDGDVVDSELIGEESFNSDEKPKTEINADQFAAGFLISESELKRFVISHDPLYYTRDIQGFAAVQKVHPGLFVGQLQHKGYLKYYQFRDLLVKVRHIVTDSVLTDGWDSVVTKT